MSSRPSLTSRRPLSAIFIGSVPSSQLPDLPDPPSSPTSSSGLPSPPATNSTGSGGAGEGNTSSGSIRVPSTSNSVTTMSNGGSNNYDNDNEHSGSRTPSDEADDANDEDHTARLQFDRHKSVKSTYADENASALQRVKSLTQRNRLVLDKLASISSGSRLSTPSPPNARRFSRSPAPSTTQSTTSHASSSNLRRERSQSLSLLSRSGSETERERFPTSESPPDDLLAETPPSVSAIPPRPESVRQRLTSAPVSPERVPTQLPTTELSGGRTSVLGESSTLGRRGGLRSASRASIDIEAAALAAVASTRRSPTSASGRRRQPLPREFRDMSSLDGRRSVLEPPTPKGDYDRNASPALHSGRVSPSPNSQGATLNDSPQSPRRPYRHSTVREMTRRHQTRFMSQDLSPPPRRSLDDSGIRSQFRRGGSNESPLNPGGRSVIGESLRAAGLTRRKDEGEDVFGGAESSLQAGRRQRLSGDLAVRAPLANANISESRPGTRLSNRPGTSEGLSLSDPRTPATSHLKSQRAAHLSLSPRPSTSMAIYREEPRTAPLLRNFKSAYPIQEKERQTSLPPNPGRPPSRTLFTNSAHDRQYSSPSALGWHASTPLTVAAGASSSTPEHARLMLDSLNMFESQLARLPSMGSTTTVTIPELFRSAQHIVHSANSLNGMLRDGTARALERQIDAEVEDGADEPSSSEVWARVGSEYRDSLRMSDELVRTMTSFLLGVGKLLKEATPERTQSHQRTGSLDEGTARRPSPDVSLTLAGKSSDGKRSTDGRNSIDLKRRWELPSRDESGGKNTISAQSSQSQSRAPTSLHSQRSTDLNDLGERADRERHDVATDLSKRFSTMTLTSGRRTTSGSGGDVRDAFLRHAPSLSFSSSNSSGNLLQPEGSQGSQTSSNKVHFTSTAKASGAPRRPLPPAPLPTLPSESILNRSGSVRTARRAKTVSTTNATVRAPATMFPSLTSSSSNPTTAVTTTPASPERPSSVRRTAQRTLSRTTAAAFAGLQQQYERDGRQRTISAGEGAEDDAHTNMVESSRRTLNSRPRMSLDGKAADLNWTASDRRERRGTVAGLFSRN